MTPEQWERVGQIVAAAVALQPDKRASFLDQVCGQDKTLRREVESLLTLEGKDKGFLSGAAIEDAVGLFKNDEPRFSAGKRLGNYEVLEFVEAGGMGEIYKARHITLGNTVALKFLPTVLAADQNRLRRLEQEARAASALNHPNIITVHDFVEAEQSHFIVSEYVEGETLRERIRCGRLDLHQAIDIATQIATGLAAAHAVGVIHRDIKPENIMVRRDQIVKVLDFGLAKLTETNGQAIDTKAPTKALLTEPGRVMGTLAYMSPEQVRGVVVDARADIWSLGVIIYEMVTGRAPFSGETANHIAVAILEKEPASLVSLAPNVPQELQRIVRKSLAKDREERYQTARDLLIDLKNLNQNLTNTAMHRAEAEAKAVPPEDNKRSGETHTANTAPDARLPSRKSIFWGAGVTALLLAATVAAYWYFIRPSHSTPLPPLTAIPLTSDPGFEGMPSLSPDGNYVAYIAGEPEKDFDLYVKQIGGGPPSRLTTGPAVEEFPAWAPDGLSIAFVRPKGDKLEVLSITPLGGSERKLAEVTADKSTYIFSWVPPYLSWTPDSKYLVTMDRLSPEEPYGLFILSVATGEKRRLTTPPAPATADGNPAISPDGRTLAFVRVVAQGTTQVCVLPLSENYGPAGEARCLDLPQQFLTSPAWTADGREIVYSASGPWSSGESRLWRVPVSGVEKPQPLATVGENGSQATISRQGHRLVYADWKYNNDIWRAELNGHGKSSAPVKLIASTHLDGSPQYSPNGSRIAFGSDRSGHGEIWVSNSDGSSPVQLTTLESSSGSPQWFPDGRRIVFDLNQEGQSDIYVMDLESRVPRRLTSDPSDDTTPSVSHDGKWIYFSSKRTGRFEIWRLPTEGGEATQVTHNGGLIPFESVDGKTIYYAKAPDETEVWKVPVSGGDEARVLGPVSLIQFAVVADGIYFIEPGTEVYVGSKGNSLKFYNFAKGTTERVVDIKLTPQNGLSISPDGRYALMTLVDPFVCDLKLVENFQ